MPQYPSQVLPALKGTTPVALLVDSTGALIVADNTNGELSSLNITAATLVKLGAGYISRAVVTVAGSGAGTVNDAATSGGGTAANTIAALPMAVGPIALDFPFVNGLVITPGTGQTITVSYR